MANAVSCAMQAAIVEAYLPQHRSSAVSVQGIVTFFRAAKALAPTLSDGAAPPPYNLRTLTRALQYTVHAAPVHGVARALYDGFSMCFVSMLDGGSARKVDALILEHILRGAKVAAPAATAQLPAELAQRRERFVNVEV